MEADLSNRDILKGRAEAVLFALGRAVTLNELNIALETDVMEVKKVLSELMDEYENDRDQIDYGRPSPILCKPPMWCKIETTHWRNFYVKKKQNPGRK